jgi:16S rRNA (guanine966-N2)-methyltransferase
VRIIGGEWRSRLLRFPDGAGLRPTADRVRETLFNWLGQDLSGYVCLDLFAGSGALGFEAASRGAAEVTMVEKSLAAFMALEANARALSASRVRLERGDAIEFLGRVGRRYDVVFVDPPFAEIEPEPVLERVAPRLAERGRVYVECGRPLQPMPGWRVHRQSRAGQVHFHLLERDAASEASDDRSLDEGSLP